MRPKKIVLCVESDENNLSVLKFMLETNGYAVATALNAEEAVAHFRNGLPDLALVAFDLPGTDGEALVRNLKGLAACVPAVLMGDQKHLEGKLHQADAFVWKERVSACELLECIRQKSARKRGPRKGMHRMTAVAV